MTNYKRPNDQYKINKSGEMVEQLKIEELNRKRQYQCTYNTIINYTNFNFYGSDHTGIVSHKCSLEKDHKEFCQCICGTTFQGWGEKRTVDLES